VRQGPGLPTVEEAAEAFPLELGVGWGAAGGEGDATRTQATRKRPADFDALLVDTVRLPCG
jgi:hypothetical protein